MTSEEEVIRLRQENRALRERIQLLEEQLRVLSEQGQMQEEQAKKRQAVQEQELGQLKEQVQGLEERLKKDSHNSHLPPSSDRFHRQPKSLRKPSDKPAGGQKGHPGSTLMLSPTPDEVIVHGVEACVHCHGELRAVESLQVERRQVIDLPPKRVVVIEHQAEQKQCPVCQQISTGAFPDDVRAAVQYSAAFGAVGVYLVQQQFLPYERACEVIQDLLGPTMSVGTLQAMVQRCAAALEPVEAHLKAALSRAAVLHQDETGLYVAGKRSWLHVSATDHLTHYQVHPKRGQQALEAIAILASFEEVSVHDGWSSYWRYPCQHALCNVHHLRELTFLHEEQHLAWAEEMKTLLLDGKAAVEEARAAGRAQLHPLELADWQEQYEQLLEEGYLTTPPDPPPQAQKRGRRKQSPARNLLDRLCTHQEAVLAFLTNFAVPFDNSQAERDIRMVKVQQKVSGCFRSLPGAQAFCRIRSYLSTLRKQGVPVLLALEQALSGHPVFPAF
ncbi:MAG TPA: IS66 family transposase [Ktedonobacteraceae bacterium]|nr:IS66 family transposase [Ktedonobacteraceae bacterium]